MSGRRQSKKAMLSTLRVVQAVQAVLSRARLMLFVQSGVQCYCTSTELDRIRAVRDGESRTATSTFTQLWVSGVLQVGHFFV